MWFGIRIIPSASKGGFWPALLLGFITLLVFFPVLHHKFIESWDDNSAILLNPDYNPPSLGNLVHYWTKAPHQVFYIPVTYSLWGLLAMISRSSAPPGVPFNPAFFYAANWLTHAASSVLVFLILRKLVRQNWAAWLGAGLFALHPIQVEAVAFAWTVYTPLSAMFCFAAIWEYLIYSDLRSSRENVIEQESTRHAAWPHYGMASAAFVLAMLTKPTAVSVPLMVAAIEVWLRGRTVRTLLLPLGAWLAIVPLTFLINEHGVPASDIFVPWAPLRPLVPLDAIAFYLGKIFVPLHFSMDYGRTPQSVAGIPAISLSCLIALALLVLTWFLRRRWPWLMASFAVFVAGLLPAIGIVPFSFQRFSTVADRYVYLAMLGPAIAAAILLARFPQKILRVASIAILIFLGSMSVKQLHHWQDDWKLAAYTLETNPQSKASVLMFQYLFDPQGHHDLANRLLPAASQCSLDPATLMEVGHLLAHRGRSDLAAECYRRAHLQDPPITEHSTPRSQF